MTAPALPRSNFNQPGLTTILFAVMVKRLGGSVVITQADIDQVAYCQLIEDGMADGSIEFVFKERTRQ